MQKESVDIYAEYELRTGARMLTIEERVARLAATKETRAVDFKSTFDPAQTADRRDEKR
jgi:hypothetical protein